MSDRIVIYHADCPDGFTAAWVAWTLYGDAAEYLPAKYGDAPPDVAGKDVDVLDFSYPRDVLLTIARKARSIRVLDHHASAERALGGLEFCKFDMNESGATLAWKTLYPNLPVRAICAYVRDRDLWLWDLPHSKEISARISVQPRDFCSWSELAARLERSVEDLQDVAALGDAILRHVEVYVDAVGKNARMMRVHLGLECHEVPVVNAPGMMISELVGKLAENEPFAVGWHQEADGRFKYSLRSRGPKAVDVSRVAEAFGGSGHPNAAGFYSNWIPDGLFDAVDCKRCEGETDESEKPVPGTYAEKIFATGSVPAAGSSFSISQDACDDDEPAKGDEVLP